MSKKVGKYLKTQAPTDLKKDKNARHPYASVQPQAQQLAADDVQIVQKSQDGARARKYLENLRQSAAGLRQKASDFRQQIFYRCTKNAGQRDDIAKFDEATKLREHTADHTEQVATSKAPFSLVAQALLRDVNERLIISSLRAQAMAESAELAKEQMSYMASHDYLTGLPNRSLLNDRMAQAIALAQRHHKKVALLFMDLDHFKDINDSLGHPLGDQLLKSIATRLQANVRESDTVCRQGGDEFVVLLNDIQDSCDASLSAEKILKSMRLPHLVDGHFLNVTFSIGISIYPDHGKDHVTLAKNADIAMYRAKEKGRNTYQVFAKEMEVRALTRRSMEQKLQEALAQRKFVLHYQPKVNLEKGEITGVEALVRIQESQNQLVYPVDFINIAEECGLIVPIGKWVLQEACSQMQAWLESGFDIGHMAVNVSSKEFLSQDFLAGVISTLFVTGLEPHRLELEVTESLLIKDTEQVMEILRALKKLGVWIAIDDFGTGYSSLSYLTRLPLDTLKIDQSFVRNLTNVCLDTENVVISAIIAMAESLKYRVVAEGIETKQQLAILQSKDCKEGQGYYFSRPVAAEILTTWMASSGLCLWPQEIKPV